MSIRFYILVHLISSLILFVPLSKAVKDFKQATSLELKKELKIVIIGVLSIIILWPIWAVILLGVISIYIVTQFIIDTLKNLKGIF